MPNPVITQVVMDANTISTIISNINSMYSNVIAYTVGLVAFVGILLPVAISFFQNRQLKLDHKALSEKISLDMQEAKTALTAEIKNDLEKEIQSFEKKLSDMKNELKSDISKNKSSANAKAHHLQANTSIKNANYVGAFSDCASSIVDYSIAKDEANLKKVLDVLLIGTVFQHLKKDDFEKNDEMEKWYKDVLAVTEKLNENGRYAESLKSLKNKYKEALSR